MFRKLILLSILLFAAVGCIKEDDDCLPGNPTGLRLRFRFTYNSDDVDLLNARVRNIRAYIFDQSNKLLVDTIHLGATEIARGYVDVSDLPDGFYTISAWGGSSADMMSNGFMDTRMASATGLNPSHTNQAVIGQTTLSEFRMMLSYDRLPDAVRGDIAPSSGNQFDDLFHAVQEDVQVDGTRSQDVDFNFIRNTNLLKIKVEGLDQLWSYNPTRAAGDSPLEIFALGKNGRYQYDNTIDQGARIVRYESPDVFLTSSTLEVDIKTLRLDAFLHTQTPITLHMNNVESGEAMVPELKVLQTIMSAVDSRGNLVYPSQEALDREYEFQINLSVLTDLSMSVTVNGFQVKDLTPIIDRPQ